MNDKDIQSIPLSLDLSKLFQVGNITATTEQLSLGRAAEIAGLNYFVFMEKLREAGIALVEAEVETEAQ